MSAYIINNKGKDRSMRHAAWDDLVKLLITFEPALSQSLVENVRGHYLYDDKGRFVNPRLTKLECARVVEILTNIIDDVSFLKRVRSVFRDAEYVELSI